MPHLAASLGLQEAGGPAGTHAGPRACLLPLHSCKAAVPAGCVKVLEHRRGVFVGSVVHLPTCVAAQVHPHAPTAGCSQRPGNKWRPRNKSQAPPVQVGAVAVSTGGCLRSSESPLSVSCTAFKHAQPLSRPASAVLSYHVWIEAMCLAACRVIWHFSHNEAASVALSSQPLACPCRSCSKAWTSTLTCESW